MRFQYKNPMFYLIDGFRHAILGVGDVSFAAAFAVSGTLTAVLFVWAAWLIGNGKGLRS